MLPPIESVDDKTLESLLRISQRKSPCCAVSFARLRSEQISEVWYLKKYRGAHRGYQPAYSL